MSGMVGAVLGVPRAMEELQKLLTEAERQGTGEARHTEEDLARYKGLLEDLEGVHGSEKVRQALVEVSQLVDSHWDTPPLKPGDVKRDLEGPVSKLPVSIPISGH